MFTSEAIELIYTQTEGYPRRVGLLCHNLLEHMVMHDKKRVDLQLVHRVIENEIAMDDFREMQVTESIEVPSVAKAMDPKRGAWSVKSGAENVSPSAMLRIVGA